MKSLPNHSPADQGANSFIMLRFFKRAVALALLAMSIQLSHGFALLGPFEGYQTADLGYDPNTYTSYGQFGGLITLADLGGPHNQDEEFRRNTPVLYYSCDASFLGFFGSNGVAAVDQAFNIMNTLTNVSMYSPELFEFPQKAQQINFEAQSMYLTDVKSAVLHHLVEQMGLAQPERFTWTLRARSMGNVCPDTGRYLVIRRNFDIMQSSLNQTMYSSYVNGILYTYGIMEYCPPSPPLAETIPYSVDPNADAYSAVATDSGPHRGFIVMPGIPAFNAGGIGLRLGGYYTYLTRDDMAGLRYLLRADNYNFENSGPGTVQFVTNSFSVVATNLLYDLGLLIQAAPTNNAAALQALFPGLLVEDTANWWGLGYSTNISLVVTSSPFAPAGYVRVISVTNVTVFPQEYFSHTYGNIITNSYSPKSVYRTQIVSPGTSPFSPAGSPPTLVTNTSKLITLNSPSGSFYVLPTNLCAIKILFTLYTNVVATTNLIFSTSGTNSTGTGSNDTYTVSTITYFTNNWLVYLPVTCPADTIGLRGGVERIQFKRRDFDSLIGTFWQPVTTNYTLMELTNNALRPQAIQRTVTQPDFLFIARDQAGGNTFNGTIIRNINFNQAFTNGLAGPGTITTPTTFEFNKIGDSYWNLFDFNISSSSWLSPYFISDESAQIQGLVWASFDGTTNAPVVYPNGTSLANLISQMFLRITSQPAATITNGLAELPAGTQNFAYTNTLSVTGGQAPYTWSLAPSSAGFPAGLNFSSITNTGESILLTGTLTATPATYDFTVRVTDATSRFVDAPFSLTINP